MSPPEAGKYTCTANNFIKQYHFKAQKNRRTRGLFSTLKKREKENKGESEDSPLSDMQGIKDQRQISRPADPARLP